MLRRPRQEPRKPPGNPTPPGQNRETTRTGKRATATKKNKKEKAKAGGWAWPWCRCRQRSTGRRRSARAGRRNTRGTPNPLRGVWVSPAPERKRRKKEHGVDEQTRQREEGGHRQIKTKHGSGLEGLRVPENTPTPEKNKDWTLKQTTT